MHADIVYPATPKIAPTENREIHRTSTACENLILALLPTFADEEEIHKLTKKIDPNLRSETVLHLHRPSMAATWAGRCLGLLSSQDCLVYDNAFSTISNFRNWRNLILIF